VIHRGMGDDAHTASLFPRDPLIQNRGGIAAATYVEKFSEWRVTLLPGVLAAARRTAMLVTGKDKAEPLAQVLHDPFDPMRLPAQIGTLEISSTAQNAVWFVDSAAAAKA
jgi:6-phosphogluconolactonase